MVSGNSNRLTTKQLAELILDALIDGGVSERATSRRQWRLPVKRLTLARGVGDCEQDHDSVTVRASADESW